MKKEFSLKIFFAFLAFGFILYIFIFLLTYKNLEKKIEQDNINRFLHYVKNIEKRLKTTIEHNSNILNTIYKEDYFINFKKKILKSDLETIVVTHPNILEISIYNNFGENILSARKNSDKINRDVNFIKIKRLVKNRLWHSGFELAKKQGEIEYPLSPIIYFVKKNENHTLVMYLSMKEFLSSVSDELRYLISKDGNIIYDKNGKYTWAKEHNSEFELKDIFPKFNKIILKNDFSIFPNYMFKKIKINDSNYLIAINDSISLSLEEFIKTYSSELYNISFLMSIISFILAIIFATPLLNLNRKIMDEKDSLYSSMEKNSTKLNNSLEVIDQHIMYIQLDSSFNIKDVSFYFCYISGFQKEELIGHPYSILFNWEDYEFFKTKVIEQLKKSGRYNGEVLCKRKMGRDYWTKSYIEANYENGRIVSYTEIRTDITDNKRIEKLYHDLNYQIEQLNTIFQSADTGIALIDFKGNIRKFNKAFKDIFNYNDNELSKENFFNMVDKRSKNFLEKVVNETKEYGSTSNVELIFLSKNLEDIFLNLSLKVLPDKSNLVAVINSLEDKRKLQELNQTLELRVKEEVEKNIEKDKLHQEQQIKNAKLTSIGTLAAGITHEINTPLTYLKGNFEMLKMDIDDLIDEQLKNDMMENCIKIDDAIKRIAIIVESMREMSQSSSEIKEKTNIFSTLITSLTMAYNVSKQISKIYINEKEFTLTNMGKNDSRVYAHVQKQRLEQVWIIIINNALDELKNIDFYEKRKLNIELYKDKVTKEVVVKFKDNAGGIKKDILPKIFEPFISSKVHAGIGVGLNIAKKIIDEQDGKIIAYNDEEGAIFEVRFKLS